MEEGVKFGFEELEIWKKARAFRNEVSVLVKHFPSCERYKLTDQLLRSSRSITALIAEGHGRFTYPDQIHFCIQARGSLSETVDHLITAFDEKYITPEQLNELKQQAKTIERILNGYIGFLRKKRSETK